MSQLATRDNATGKEEKRSGYFDNVQVIVPVLEARPQNEHASQPRPMPATGSIHRRTCGHEFGPLGWHISLLERIVLPSKSNVCAF